MSAWPVKHSGAPAAAQRARVPARSTAAPSASGPLALLADRLLHRWLPRIVWSLSRTGRPGLAGLALLGASGVFFLSTQRPMSEELLQLQADLSRAQADAAKAPRAAASAAPSMEGLPARAEIPQRLAVLLKQAEAARLSIDTAKYEIAATKTGTLMRYQLSFPVAGPYPQIREFIDSVLVAMPALAIEELSISRKTIADPAVEAQVRMTLFTRSTP